MAETIGPDNKIETDNTISEFTQQILDILNPLSRKKQNRVIVGVVGQILKERRNEIQSKRDEIEEVDKDMEELRSLIVNVNSTMIQQERKTT